MKLLFTGRPQLPPGEESPGTDIDELFDPIAEQAKKDRRNKRAQDKLDLEALDRLRQEEAKIEALKKAEKEREEAERQAKIISDLEAEADAAAAEEKARRDAEREKTPDLRIGGANFEVPGPEDAETNRTNKEKIVSG